MTKEEIKKGCGKSFISPLPEKVWDKCGDILDGKVELCSECSKKGDSEE